MFGQIGVAILCCELLVAQTSPPEREVKGNVIRSAANPKVRIQLPATGHYYVGADRWVLYGSCTAWQIANCTHWSRPTSGKKSVGFTGFSSKGTCRAVPNCNIHMPHPSTRTSAEWTFT